MHPKAPNRTSKSFVIAAPNVADAASVTALRPRVAGNPMMAESHIQMFLLGPKSKAVHPKKPDHAFKERHDSIAYVRDAFSARPRVAGNQPAADDGRATTSQQQLDILLGPSVYGQIGSLG